ncbi:formate hydrogenlyase subunit 3 [Escherichia coli]|uniref:Formate hydrogenlyase subunit 3 n=1 Tax=Escherichia coli TaxID=562 RepID=A0A484YYM5_ECOLX|nr:formate hydrogenlyase subunit 3 [Escherichia coli]
MITAFVGGLYALMEHNIQRLLAYHTLENIGIILLGLGRWRNGYRARTTGADCPWSGWVVCTICLTHSLFQERTVPLVRGASGSVPVIAISKNSVGIGKKMPVISIAMLVGLMAMAALPPLNGFAGGMGYLSILLQTEQ